MSDKDEKNPEFEEFQKNIRSLLSNIPPGNIHVAFNSDDEDEEATEDEAPPDDTEAEDQKEALRRIRDFNLKPREVRDYLDRFVISQNEAKKVLSVAICDHYNHVRQCLETPDLLGEDYAKQNVILLGPTGVGKTYLVRCISRLIGVPFVKADATKFSETGYVGRDVEDLVRDLVKLAGRNLELAQYGIIYIDEIDKIAAQTTHGGRDVSGRGVQINLLKLMEDTEVSLHSQTDLIGQMESIMEMMHGGGKDRPRSLNTRHILFIVSGAFDYLAESVKKRVQGAQIGFGHSAEREAEDDSKFLHYVETRDFVDFGFEPEFIGRLPVRVVCSQLSAGDLEEILLQSEGSILKQYKADFDGYGIELKLLEEAVGLIAGQAHKEKTGARGLMTVLERLFRDFKFELPSTPIKALEVSAATVAEPRPALEELLNSKTNEQRKLLRAEVRRFAERFREQFNLRLNFSKDAIEALVDLSLETGKTIRALCEQKFRDFQFGLTLIARSSGQDSFEVSKEAVADPDEALSQWVVEHFRNAKNDRKSND